ncbi:MAG: hypothetical protein ACTSRC_22295 [Candidatus Helarchaeota archaeon]
MVHDPTSREMVYCTSVDYPEVLGLVKSLNAAATGYRGRKPEVTIRPNR